MDSADPGSEPGVIEERKTAVFSAVFFCPDTGETIRRLLFSVLRGTFFQDEIERGEA